MQIKTLTFRAVILGLLTIAGASSVFAQQTGYSQTNLVANSAGVANHTDPQLSNPWGISFIPGQPFWIANNNGGTSTLYDAQGNKDALVVNILARKAALRGQLPTPRPEFSATERSCLIPRTASSLTGRGRAMHSP